jgi:hypothetical protein
MRFEALSSVAKFFKSILSPNSHLLALQFGDFCSTLRHYGESVLMYGYDTAAILYITKLIRI